MSGPSTSPFSDADVRRYLAMRADVVAARASGADVVATRIAERTGLLPRRRSLRGRTVRLAVLVALLGALLLAGLYLVGRERERYTPREPEVTTQLRGSPWAMATADGSVWAGAYREPLLFRLDPATGAILDEVPLRGVVCGQLEPALGYLWFSECGVFSLARLDPATLQIARLAGYGSDRVAFDDQAVWAPGELGVERIDPDSLETTRTVAVDGTGLLAVGFESVWLSDADGGVVRRIQPDTGTTRLVGWPDGPARPYPVHIAAGADAIWVVDERVPALFRIDPQTNSATRTGVALELIDGTGFGDHLVVAAGEEIWIRASATSVVRVDPVTLGAAERVETPAAGGGAFAVTDGAIWIANMKDQTVTGIDRP